MRLLYLAICSHEEPDWIGSFFGRFTVLHLSHGTMNQKMTMKTWRMTQLYLEQRHWRPNKPHTVGLLVNEVLFHARGTCALFPRTSNHRRKTHQRPTPSGHNHLAF